MTSARAEANDVPVICRDARHGISKVQSSTGCRMASRACVGLLHSARWGKEGKVKAMQDRAVICKATEEGVLVLLGNFPGVDGKGRSPETTLLHA
jgi:hypothetical protein